MKFEIGNLVKIINPGKSYTSYNEASLKLKLSNWDYKKIPNSEGEYMIISCYKIHNPILYGIENTKTKLQYIINEEGIEVLVPNNWYLPITSVEMAKVCNEWRLRQPKCNFVFANLEYSILLSSHEIDNSYYYGNNVQDILILRDEFLSESYYKNNNYKEITFEFFQTYINNKQQPIMATSIKLYKINKTQLNTYWDNASDVQQKYLTDNFKLDGTTTKEAIKGLYDIACGNWKPKIKRNHPDCFEDDKSVDLSIFENDEGIIQLNSKSAELAELIQIRSEGKHANKAFYLNNDDFVWQMVVDEDYDDILMLVPTKK